MNDPRFSQAYPSAIAKAGKTPDTEQRYESKVYVCNLVSLYSVDVDMTLLYEQGWRVVGTVQNRIFLERPLKQVHGVERC